MTLDESIQGMRLQVIRRARARFSSRPMSSAGCWRSRSPRTWGAARLAAHAQRLWGLRVAPSTVQRLLRRQGLATRRQRLLVLEHHSARGAGLLTERTRQTLWRLRHSQTRHVTAERPGEHARDAARLDGEPVRASFTYELGQVAIAFRIAIRNGSPKNNW
jgi:hypothetical protein